MSLNLIEVLGNAQTNSIKSGVSVDRAHLKANHEEKRASLAHFPSLVST